MELALLLVADVDLTCRIQVGALGRSAWATSDRVSRESVTRDNMVFSEQGAQPHYAVLPNAGRGSARAAGLPALSIQGQYAANWAKSSASAVIGPSGLLRSPSVSFSDSKPSGGAVFGQRAMHPFAGCHLPLATRAASSCASKGRSRSIASSVRHRYWLEIPQIGPAVTIFLAADLGGRHFFNQYAAAPPTTLLRIAGTCQTLLQLDGVLL